MARNSNAKKDTYDAYVNPNGEDDSTSLGHAKNIPYIVKSQFAKEMMAEFVTTFVTMLFGLACMTQVVLSSEASGSFVTIALCWGLAFFFGITVGGGVSGTHLNPAVTTTPTLLKQLPWKKVLFYILNQVVASYVAALVVYVVYRPMFNEVERLILGILALLDQHNRPIGAKAVPPAIGALVSTIAMGFAMNTGLAINRPGTLPLRVICRLGIARVHAQPLLLLDSSCGADHGRSCGCVRERVDDRLPPPGQEPRPAPGVPILRKAMKARG